MTKKKKVKYLIIIVLFITVTYLLYSSGFIKGFLDGINSVD